MPTNTFPDIGELTQENQSVVADGKTFYQAQAKADAFELRYGKKISCMASLEYYENKQPKECTLRIQSAKNGKYVITEFLKEDGSTDCTFLCYSRGPSNIETKFSQYLHAEVTLADLIAGE